MRHLAIIVFSLCLAFPCVAQQASPPRSEIEAIVREYILQHPEILMESVQLHQQRQRAAQQHEAGETIANRQKELYNDPASPIVGKASGKVPVVVFFDYRCGYCKLADSTVLQLTTEDSGARVIFKELPILSPESAMAASAALAAHKQGRYVNFHHALMSSKEAITADSLERIASTLALNIEKFRADMRSPDIAESLARNQKLAFDLGVRSTPSFVIGSELVSGTLDEARLKALITKAGTSQKALNQQF